jgi:tetratricopeptide (TPR) repeat protein
MNNIASIFLQLNSFEDAKTYSQMALSHKNDYVPSLINVGIALARLGITEEAESYLVRALTLEPDNRYALFNIAILYEKKENFKKAREYYLKLHQLGDMQGSIGLERTKAGGQDK